MSDTNTTQNEKPKKQPKAPKTEAAPAVETTAAPVVDTSAADAAKAEAAAKKAAEKAAKDAAKAEEKAKKDAEKAAAKALKDAERAEKKAQREAEKEARKNAPKAPRAPKPWEDLPAGAQQKMPREGSVGYKALELMKANNGATLAEIDAMNGPKHPTRRLLKWMHVELGFGFVMTEGEKIRYLAPNLPAPVVKTETPAPAQA